MWNDKAGKLDGAGQDRNIALAGPVVSKNILVRPATEGAKVRTGPGAFEGSAKPGWRPRRLFLFQGSQAVRNALGGRGRGLS